MRVSPSGVTFVAECELQMSNCTARQPAPITAVFPENEGRQVDVCRNCLQDMIRTGDWAIPGARISQYADIIVYDDNQRPQVVIEAQKAPTEIGESIDDWAFRVHHNMLAHKAVPFSTYFWLVATNGQFRLWKHQGQASTMALPDYSGNIGPQIDGLMEGLEHEDVSSTKRLSRAILEWIDIVKRDDYGENAPLWLTESGLLNTLRTGRVRTEFAQ